MTVDHSIAIALVDELETLGARFSFFLDSKDQIAFTWLCGGVARFERCREILHIGFASDIEFGDVFRNEIEDRYVAGRMRMFSPRGLEMGGAL